MNDRQEQFKRIVLVTSLAGLTLLLAGSLPLDRIPEAATPDSVKTAAALGAELPMAQQENWNTAAAERPLWLLEVISQSN